MQNKRHNILDDAWEMKEELMGEAAHSLRIGLITNTVMNSIPLVIPDISKLMEVPDDFKVDFTDLGKLSTPVLLHTSNDDLQLAILIVHDKDSDHIQCYPFNNVTDGYWWAYEMAFDMVPGGQIEIRPIHTLLEEFEFEPTQEMMAHLEALAIICSAFVYRYQRGEIELTEETEDFSKINKKRVRNKKTPIVNNWIPTYVNSED